MQAFSVHAAREWEAIRAAFLAKGDASMVLAGRTRLVDAAVTDAYHQYLAPGFASGLALVAVGGYGRRELFPHSDVDLLVLVDRDPSASRAKDALSTFLRALWDQRLRLSHSVRTPAECAELHANNVELNVSLLDERFLAGDRDLYEKLAARLPKFLRAQSHALGGHLRRLTRARHAKYQDTIFHLEPNVKETPGGLRDLHLLGWLGQLRRFRAGTPGDEPSPLDDPPIAAARGFIHTARCFLHFQSGRDQNLLSFEAQEEITEQIFLRPREPASWMRDYFRHAREVHRAALRAMETAEGAPGSLITQFRDWRSRLSNADFTVSREQVLLKSPHAFDHDPEAALRLFLFVARHGFRLAADTERRLAVALPRVRRHFQSGGPFWPVLRELLELPHVSLALREMHEAGFLQALFPEWDRIDSLVVRDFYHRYTVDEHTLLAIQSLTGLRHESDPARQRFADLLAEVEQPGVLYFALLFHDTGKGGGEGRHIAASLELAEAAMARIQMPPAGRKMVRFLIERHLDLSAAMTSRDLEDAATARALAAGIETVEQLKNLTLLTYADISAVNPSAMTPWRLDQLWRAYLVAYRELTRELDTGRIHDASAVPDELAAFLEGFPLRYLRTHSEAEVASHLALERGSRIAGVAVDLVRRNGTYALAVVTRDRPFLFASLAGALSSFGMNILKAEAFSNRRGTVLDTFVFSDPNRTLELNPPEAERLRRTVERVALGRQDVKELLRFRPKTPAPSRGARIQPRVAFDAEASATSTLVEIVAQDRPGLLYDLASTLSDAGCNIEVVLIDTEAHKALDVFYVTSEGRKLSAELQRQLRERLLSVCA